jgi:hypothetical protein
MRRFLAFASMLATCAGLATAAHAAVPIASPTSNPFDVLPPAAGQVLVNDFDGNTAAGFSFSGGTLRIGNVGSQAAAPAGDATQYMAAEAGNPFILFSPATMTSMSLYIGSLDSYNVITFLGAGGFSQSFNGTALGAPANGNQLSGVTNRQFFFTFDASDQIDQVIFSTSRPAFEIDNIYASTVPEPAVWTMLILGFGSIGFMLRQQRKAALPA